MCLFAPVVDTVAPHQNSGSGRVIINHKNMAEISKQIIQSGLISTENTTIIINKLIVWEPFFKKALINLALLVDWKAWLIPQTHVAFLEKLVHCIKQHFVPLVRSSF